MISFVFFHGETVILLSTTSLLPPSGTCSINHPFGCISSHSALHCLLSLGLTKMLISPQPNKNFPRTSPPSPAASCSSLSFLEELLQFLLLLPFLPLNAHPMLLLAVTPETLSNWPKVHPYIKLPTGHLHFGVLWASQTLNVQNQSPHLLSKPVPPSPTFQISVTDWHYHFLVPESESQLSCLIPSFLTNSL